ncbi:MAG TPA: hypothetical protein VJN63_05210 [Thermoplasmata archaeon]|nr:hypothetical protein [Thermoplasmata archaeon]
MFGNKNAGLHETLPRLRLYRHTPKPKNVVSEAFSGTPRYGLDRILPRETYFAIRTPIRWLQ